MKTLTGLIALGSIVWMTLGSGETRIEAGCLPSVRSVEPTSIFIGQSITIRGECLPSAGADATVDVSMEGADLTVTEKMADGIVVQVMGFGVGDRLDVTIGESKTAIPIDVHNWMEPPAGTYREGLIEVEIAEGTDIQDVAKDLDGTGWAPSSAMRLV